MLLVALVINLSLWSALEPAHAQENSGIQVLTVSLEPGEFLACRVPGLHAGQVRTSV